MAFVKEVYNVKKFWFQPFSQFFSVCFLCAVIFGISFFNENCSVYAVKFEKCIPLYLLYIHLPLFCIHIEFFTSARVEKSEFYIQKNLNKLVFVVVF